MLSARLCGFISCRQSLRLLVTSVQHSKYSAKDLRRPRIWKQFSHQTGSMSSMKRSAMASAASTRPSKESDLVPSHQTLIQYIKEKASKSAVRKIVQAVEDAEEGTGPWGSAGFLPDSTAYRTAIRALLKANRTDLAIQLYRKRMTVQAVRPAAIDSDFPLAANVVKAVLRDCKKRDEKELHVSDILQDLLSDCDGLEFGEPFSERDIVSSRMLTSLLSITTALLNNGDDRRARDTLHAAGKVAEYCDVIDDPIQDCNNLIRVLGKKKMVDEVFDVLDLIRSSGSAPNNETFEFLANAAAKQVQFITGAVSMSTLPEPLAAEVAFAGRSNVGKSSLVNMLCNRKAMAYVSGRPGKTQQFNYFLVNERDLDSRFYIVDMPGVGYAKVPKPMQQAWLKFMDQYFRHRTSLRLVFHLVDGRHGALADDEALMAQVAATDRADDYVIVLTKMDKMDKQKAKQTILDKTRAALVRNGCPAHTPIVLTSASTKLGREEMWRQLHSALRHLPAVRNRGGPNAYNTNRKSRSRS